MQQIKDELNSAIKQRDMIDRFLSRFLEQFEMKMDYEEPNSPHWKLYKDKTAKRMQLSDKIRSLQFKLKGTVTYA